MSITNQTIGGIKWNGLGTVTTALLQILKLFIVARFVSKGDLGLLATAVTVFGLTEIFANMGIATGLIHKQNITRQQYSSVFWLNLMLSGTIYAVLFAVSPLIAKYYHEPRLATIIPLISLQLILSSFGKMFFTFKSKDLDFKFISIVSIVGTAIGTVTTVVLAIYNYGIYSIIYGTLLQCLIVQATYSISGMRKYRILFHFRLSEIKDIIKIGGFQLATQVLDYLAAKADILLIGRFFGQEVLGVYNLAKELVLKVIQVINPIVTSVATPAFAKFQDDKERMRLSYRKVLRFLSFINIPIFIAFFVFAEPIILVAYGPDKMDCAWFLRVLSLWGIFQSVGNPASILMVSLGRTDLGFYWTLVRIIFTLATTYVACLFSIEILTYSQVVLAGLFLFAYWRMMVYKMIQLPLTHYLLSFAFAVLAGAVAGAVSAVPAHFIESHYLQLPLLVLFGVIYLAVFFLFNRNFLKEIKSYITNRNNTTQ